MGRSVETNCNADFGIYFDLCEFIGDDDLPSDLAEELLYDPLRYMARRFAPSFEDTNGWVGYPYRETIIIAENRFYTMQVSEYFGLVWVGFVPTEDDYVNMDGLREGFLCHLEPKFRKAMVETGAALNHMGTFSNGEAVFSQAGAA